MDLHLEGRRALITGSTSGIGASIATVLAREGVTVFVNGLQEAEARRVVGQIEATGGAPLPPLVTSVPTLARGTSSKPSRPRAASTCW